MVDPTHLSLPFLLASEAQATGQGETWTMIGLVALVITGAGKGLHWIATRFAAALDNQTDKVAKSLDKHSETLVGNTTEMSRLVNEFRTKSTEMQRIEDAVERMPGRVVDELERRDKVKKGA